MKFPAWLKTVGSETAGVAVGLVPAGGAVVKGGAGVARALLTRKMAAGGVGLYSLHEIALTPGIAVPVAVAAVAGQALIVVAVVFAVAWEDRGTGGRGLTDLKDAMVSAVKADIQREIRGG